MLPASAGTRPDTTDSRTIHQAAKAAFVLPHGIQVAAAPELPVAVSVLQIRRPVEYHQAVLSLQIPHHARYAVFRRYRQQHVYMIRASHCYAGGRRNLQRGLRHVALPLSWVR